MLQRQCCGWWGGVCVLIIQTVDNVAQCFVEDLGMGLFHGDGE